MLWILVASGVTSLLFRNLAMRPATVTRVAGLNRLKACSGHGAGRAGRAGRRYLTMLHPPKFENEKMVSVS